MKELIEKFEKETGLEFYTTSLDKGEDLYSYDFVNWLIKQLPIHGVVSSLPESKDRILELERAIVSWDLKNDINDKQAFTCGWNNCYRWIKDFVRQQR